jgi:hypothetical protein
VTEHRGAIATAFALIGGSALAARLRA